MKQVKFNELKSLLTEISKERVELYKKMSEHIKMYKPSINQFDWNAFRDKYNEIITELRENDNKYREGLLEIVNKIKDESDEVIKQYCDSLIDNFDYFYNLNRGNHEQFINDVNEVVEMYYETINNSSFAS